MYHHWGYTATIYRPLSYPFRSLNKIALYEMIQGDKTMTNKYMYITNDGTQNYHFCRLKLVVETFEHSTNLNILKVPKVVKPMNEKMLL